MPPPVRLLLLSLLAVSLAAPVAAQDDAFDPDWYDASQPHVRIGVVEDGVYRVTGEALADAGVPVTMLDVATLRLLERGREVPLALADGGDGRLDDGDALTFVGHRNTGQDEAWAYGYDVDLQSSPHRSLYTDTTTYWLTWGGAEGLRYEQAGPALGGEALTAVRDTVHLEEDARYFYGDSYLAGHPLYTRGEGYYWHAFRGAQTQAYDVPLAARTGGAVDVRVRAGSESISCHRLVLEADLDGAFVPVDTVDWNGYAFADLRASLTADRLPADRETLRLRVRSSNTFENSRVFDAGQQASCEGQISGGTPNYVLLDYVEVAYRRAVHADAGAQQALALPAGDHVLAPEGFGDDPLHLYDPTHARRYAVEGTASVALPRAARLWLTPAAAYRAPASLGLDGPSDLADPDRAADYVILTASALRGSAAELADYRRSAAGGGHDVAVVEIQDVFDQFDYGRPTPLAIRRFVRATQSWASPPTLLAIWADAPYPVATADERGPRPDWAVPSFGYAPSDGWFAMHTGGPDDWSETLGIGRVPLRTDADGRLFVEKLRRYEGSGQAPWTKRMLVLAGGTDGAQQRALQQASTTWAEWAADRPTGMDTLFFYKEATSALDATFQDSLRAALRRGAGWLNYFGHSAANTWEIVTDAPREFDNAGLLPFVVSLGCRTGSFAGGRFERRDTPSFGEQLLMGSSTDDPAPSYHGAIGHFGASDSGTIPSSQQLNDHLVRAVFSDTLRVLGHAVQRAKNAFAEARGNVKHSLQYGLLGDPATRLVLPEQPDPLVAPRDVTVTPLTPVPADSHLTVHVRLRNQGLVPADSFDVALEHVAPSGATRRHLRRVPPFALEHPLAFTTPITDEDVGENRLAVRLDPTGRLDEASEFNNDVEVRHTVASTNLAVVAPRSEGIATDPRPRLRVALASAEQLGLPVVFELDTTATFDSPARRTARVEATQIYADWQPDAPLDQGQTYFWRARLDAPGAADTWQQAAFTVRPDLLEGWMQQGALFDRAETGPTVRRRDGRWQFETYSAEVTVTSERGSGNRKGNIYLNGLELPGLHLGFGFGLAVMDATTGHIDFSGSLCTYDASDRWQTSGCYRQVDGPAAVAVLDSVLTAMDEGDHLFVRTRHLARSSGVEIDEAVKALFRPFVPAPAALDTMTYRHLWTLHARKGRPGEAVQQVVPPEQPETNEIVLERRVPFLHPEGTVISPPVGPATAWEALGWEATLPDRASSVRVDVLAAEADTVLLADVAREGADLSTLDASRHPRLRLRATLADSSQRAAPQLERWHLAYRGVPDLALDPATLAATADTLQEGEPLQVSFAARNLGPEAAPRAVVEATLTDAQNRTRTVQMDTLALAADSSRLVTVPVATGGLVGANRLQMRVYQPGRAEATAYNNVLQRPFTVRADAVPPLCRVLVDGRALPHDPEPVSDLRSRELPFVGARPTIEVEVEDDNGFLALDDSSVVEVRFGSSLYGTGGLPVVPLDHPSVAFAPAERPGEPARLVFTPDLSAGDSTYTLAVTVRDASGNERVDEGDASYQVHFRVQQRVHVESLYPYPNPMSSATRFAFRLEGADAGTIDDFRLRIYTLTGRLVREFDLTPPAPLPELNDGGGLRIDWNALHWDTRDADGDLVAPGVYLYRVFLRTTDDDLDVNEGSPVERLVVIR